MREQGAERATGLRFAQHRDDRVVAGDGARDPGKRRLVDPPRDEVRGAGRGADHGQRAHHLDRQHELAHERGRAAVAVAGTHQAELVDVARDRRLRRRHALACQRRRDVVLGLRRAPTHEVEDRLLPLVLLHFAASRSTACARSISRAVMMSGGTSRIVWSSTAFTTTPASRHACCSAFARGASNSTACISPSPRTSMPPRPSRTPCNISPISAEWPTRPSRSTTPSTATDTAHASGLPPNVEPWSPGSKTSARGAARHAPIGTPPPRPFARVITSGVMPACWCANHLPVRPRPVWTSSRMSSRSRSSHQPRTPSRKPGAAGITPISPITGSSITATVFSVVAALIASRSLKGTCTKPGGSGLKGSEYLACPPAVTAARVRPWNEPVVVMISN